MIKTNKITPTIPLDAHSLEVFAIKDSKDSPTGKDAYIGFKIENGNFHFISVPYTEPIAKKTNKFLNLLKEIFIHWRTF